MISCEKSKRKRKSQPKTTKSSTCIGCYAAEVTRLRKDCVDAERRARDADGAIAQCLGRNEALRLEFSMIEERNTALTQLLYNAGLKNQVAEARVQKFQDRVDELSDELANSRHGEAYPRTKYTDRIRSPTRLSMAHFTDNQRIRYWRHQAWALAEESREHKAIPVNINKWTKNSAVLESRGGLRSKTDDVTCQIQS